MIDHHEAKAIALGQPGHLECCSPGPRCSLDRGKAQERLDAPIVLEGEAVLGLRTSRPQDGIAHRLIPCRCHHMPREKAGASMAPVVIVTHALEVRYEASPEP